MRNKTSFFALLLIWAVSFVPYASGEGMVQYFNTNYRELTAKVPELAEAGYESLWLPPPTKGSGGLSVGYDCWDRFDLGSIDQRGSVGTRYGTEAELKELIAVAHRFGIRVYTDNIMNHNAFDIPGYNADTPIDVYRGFVPEDFHLRVTEEGFFRKWDNTRNWGDEWQVQYLGLSDLIDIATEPGEFNKNFGRAEGDQIQKIRFVRHPNNPEYYCYKPTGSNQTHANGDGTYVGFGKNNGITTADLANNPEFYQELVGDMLSRSARWQLDVTKIDGYRLDAVKHTPADFFGATYGTDKDTSDYGYLGQIQRQFNLTHGYSDANHRDSVFNLDAPRDDAMVFGEHLGQPPSYQGYIDSGMRLVDNDLRNELNNRLGNPSNGLSGFDNPGWGGFPDSVSVMHAQSHDNDFAAARELQHAIYFTRTGMPLVYTDGNYQAETLSQSGGAFPRHANTNFLGQFGDPRLPNLAYIHQHFARGYQVGRWSDSDFLAYERIDKRENGSMSDADGVTALIMLNDNFANGLSRGLSTSFPSVGNTPADAYLYQYASGPGLSGFYTYASNLGNVIVPPGGYFIFSWRTPEASNAWKNAGGEPVTILQGTSPVGTITVDRRDGPDGDPGYNPLGLPDSDPTDYTYSIDVPRITDGSNLSFIARADGSAENILLKLDGGIDLNGTRPSGNVDPGFRDNPPAVTTDVFLGYEQPNFIRRQGPEKFAAVNTSRSVIGSAGAETYATTVGSGTVTVNQSTGSNPTPPDSAVFLFHDPTSVVESPPAGTPNHYNEDASSITFWAKSNAGLVGYLAYVYYTTDGTNPEGSGGDGTGSTQSIPLTYSHDAGAGSWFTGSIPKSGITQLRYKIAIVRTSDGSNPLASVFPSNAENVSRKLDMLTVFKVDGIDATTKEFYPHNDYGVTQTGLSEGFHIIQGRAFLKRDNQTSLFNTFKQTFYYDTKRPEGEILFPAENDTLNDQNYGLVVRTDSSVKEVWYFIDDGVGPNDDDETGTTNGNGAGKWVQASEAQPSASINSIYPREWRFNYVNIPSGNTAATINVRLVEASSTPPENFTATVGPADDTANHYTTLTRNVNANGPDQNIFIAFPSGNGDIVAEGYILKAYFSKSLGDGKSDQELIDEFLITIASNSSGSPDGAVAQDRSAFSVVRNETADYHAIAFPLPNLYNNDPSFLHSIQVSHTRGGVTLRSDRTVRAAVVDNAYLSITSPPAFDSDGKAYELVLPAVANPIPAQRQTTIRVQSDADITDLDIIWEFGAGTTVLADVETSGSRKIWNFTWSGIAERNYRFRVDARKTAGGAIVASQRRNVRVIFRQVLPESPNDSDDDDDGLLDSWETVQVALPTSNNETWLNGDVHVWRIFGRTNPLTPDTDGDLLPDSLEQGWRTVSAAQTGEEFTDTGYGAENIGAGNLAFDWDDANGNGLHDDGETSEPFVDSNSDGVFKYGTIVNRDTDGDGTPNFAPDLDPPFFNTVPDNNNLPNYNFNRGRTDQINGSMTNPSNPDTDNDGIWDGIEDGYNPAWANGIDFDKPVHNGWIDGDGDPLSPTESNPNNRGAWPNGKIDLGEVWLETSPTNPDTDGDGLSDGYGEDYNSNGLIDGDTNRNRVYDSAEQWTETNPLSKDTDGDGLLDGWERENGLDPLDNGTDNLATALANDGDVNQGANGDPDDDTFTNIQEQTSGTKPLIDDSVITPEANSIVIGPEPATTIGQASNSHEFAGWTADDLISFDAYEGEGGNNQGGDVNIAGDGFDSSRDITAFYARDGGADGNFYFRLDFYDLRPFAEAGNLDIYIAIDTGNTASGEAALPDQLDILTEMRWEALVAAYQSNTGRVFVDTNPAVNTDAVNQNLADGGVEIRDQSTTNGFGKAYYNSDMDAVEFSISRQALLDAGWNGSTKLRFQVFTTRDGTQNDGSGAGDLGGRNDIRDTITDDWLAEDYYSSQAYIAANGKLTNYLVADGNGLYPDQRKTAKLILLGHSNKSIRTGGEIQSTINSGFSTGYHRLIDAHEAFGLPLTLHMTPTIASAIQWAKVDPAANKPWLDGPTFNERIGAMSESGLIDLLGTTFADHMPSYFSTSYNQDNNNLSRDMLTSIYRSDPSATTFWTPERVADSDVFGKILSMGYTHTFVDQMRHLFKWTNRGTAISEDGYRINRFNGVDCFMINDQASTYRYQNVDNGLPFPLRNLYHRKATSGTQDQVVTLFHNWDEFSEWDNANAYDTNLRWVANHPWIEVVTPDEIANGQVDIDRDGSGDSWYVIDRGNASLAKTSHDYIDHSTQENYDNWYLGSANEESLRDKIFEWFPGSALPQSFGMQTLDDGKLADDSWDAVAALSSPDSNLGMLARVTAHSATLLTAFHEQQNNDLSKYSTGAYIYPDSDFNNLSKLSKDAQSQLRFASIYQYVEIWSTAPPATASAMAIDVDLDGQSEYLLTNDRIFAVFESTGGRLTAAWTREPDTGSVYQVVGNFASYSGNDTELEGASNNAGAAVNARRTSGFKDWFASGVNSNAYVNDTYNVVQGSGASWQFTSSDSKVSKLISLADSADILQAAYTLDPTITKLFVRFGMSPHLGDLLVNGQRHLEQATDVSGRVAIETLTMRESVTAAVHYSGGAFSGASFNPNATDKASGVFEPDTLTMRNQAQTYQLEMESTAQTFVIGLELSAICEDCDGDMLPRAWEITNNLDDDDDGSVNSDFGAEGDPDMDGLSNFLEYLVGLNPQVADAQNFPRITITPNNNGTMGLEFPIIADRRYRLLWSPDLSSWYNLGPEINSMIVDPDYEVIDDGTDGTIVMPDEEPRRFYKLQIEFK